MITAFIAGILALPVGDYLTRLAHVPEMEGQRGMMVFFFCLPIGIIAGSIIGFVSSFLISRKGAGGFFVAQGWALLVTLAIAILLGGVPYALSDRPPRVDGKRVELQFELRTPPNVEIPKQPDGSSIRVSLYLNDRHSDFAFVDWSSISREADHTTISGRVPIETHSQNRALLAAVGNEAIASQFFALKLPPQPTKEDEAWSDWIFATHRADLSKVPEPERFALRYRVQPTE